MHVYDWFEAIRFALMVNYLPFHLITRWKRVDCDANNEYETCMWIIKSTLNYCCQIEVRSDCVPLLNHHYMYGSTTQTQCVHSHFVQHLMRLPLSITSGIDIHQGFHILVNKDNIIAIILSSHVLIPKRRKDREEKILLLIFQFLHNDLLLAFI